MARGRRAREALSEEIHGAAVQAEALAGAVGGDQEGWAKREDQRSRGRGKG